MNRHDRKAWKAVTTWDGLGEAVIAWLNGQIRQTPGHLGPPDPETVPLIPALAAANRAGFVTDNSQQAGRDGAHVWEAWVAGFADDGMLARLRAMAAGTPLAVEACRARIHGSHGGGRWGCPWRECVDFWSDRCPALASRLRASWYVIVADPEPCRNDRLWPALEQIPMRHPGLAAPLGGRLPALRWSR